MKETQITVGHISFRYEKQIDILQDITFSAHASESIGLIGANGVGKSTLLKLLVGLNLPTQCASRAAEIFSGHPRKNRVCISRLRQPAIHVYGI